MAASHLLSKLFMYLVPVNLSDLKLYLGVPLFILALLEDPGPPPPRAATLHRLIKSY